MYFECRFKAKEIADQEYLHQCLHYVENNPLHHGLVDKVEDWLFRSEISQVHACIIQSADNNIQPIDWEWDF